MSSRRTFLPLLFLSAWALLCAGVAGHSRVTSADELSAAVGPRSGWRGPAALWLSPDGATLLAACEKSGSIVTIDTARGEKTGEFAVGKSLVALAATPDGGIDDGEGGNSKFNPPSLRGLAHSAPYFHDGRAKSLDDVFRQFKHRVKGNLSDEELNDLAAFLRSL